MGLAADDEAAASAGGADEGRRVGDEISACCCGINIIRSRGHAASTATAGAGAGIAQLQTDAALQGSRQGAVLEDEAEALGGVEGDEIAVERGAGLLEGLLVDGPDGEDVVLRCQLVQARCRCRG